MQEVATDRLGEWIPSKGGWNHPAGGPPNHPDRGRCEHVSAPRQLPSLERQLTGRIDEELPGAGTLRTGQEKRRGDVGFREENRASADREGDTAALKAAAADT